MPAPMGAPPGFFGGPQDKARDALREPKPTSIREVPGYLRRVTGKFLHRLVYIFRIVWDTRPWILFFMVFMAIFNGVTPVIGAWISAELLNTLASAYVAAASGINRFSAVMGLLILRFAYSFIVSMVKRKELPLRILIGADCCRQVKADLREQIADIESYESLASATDFA